MTYLDFIPIVLVVLTGIGVKDSYKQSLGLGLRLSFAGNMRAFEALRHAMIKGIMSSNELRQALENFRKKLNDPP